MSPGAPVRHEKLHVYQLSLSLYCRVALESAACLDILRIKNAVQPDCSNAWMSINLLLTSSDGLMIGSGRCGAGEELSLPGRGGASQGHIVPNSGNAVGSAWVSATV